MARRPGSPVVILSVLLVLTLAGWLGFDYLRTRLAASSCDAVTTLRIVAAPDIAPALTTVSQQDTEKCFKVETVAAQSGQAMESLAVTKPDVWVPESSLWLQRAQERGSWSLPVTGTSVASSPIVVGLTETAARKYGWPDKKPTWPDIFRGDPAIGFLDPAVDPVGLAALVGTGELTKKAPDPAGAYALALRKLTKHTVQEPSAIFDPALEGAVTSEVSLKAHNLVGAYADPAIPSLDYPYVVLPGTSDAQRAIAQQFLAKVLQQAPILTAAGFRPPNGTPGPDQPVVAPVNLPDDPDKLLNEWAAANRSSRMQVLLDVSGSMAAAVPKAKADRMTLTIKAAELGLGLFKKTTKIGLWRFSTNLDGDKDYQELLPVKPVGEHLASNDTLAKLRAVKAISGGATGLYDSVLAAYRSARQNWEPGRINLVVVLTDGKNEDRKGISRQELLAELVKLQDPKRPLQIIGIGIGPDIDPAELREITRATGGDAFPTPDPTKIVDTFYAALGKLLEQQQ
ncbi:substrate-binding and VWA domain-containing protein [Kibdelosporangium philippinense]|uniref:Substrate-binding and VWA domain-containing protein n=1 Tax=Kibdelosporangium philippinense TaxID=211113 RepID=A0ABS8ZU42_9PSEU|nr:substrate-binding domain-containing protein [Kibdelosporangium philippinense]MCE7010738.1 substrate-binding and VWA domain-containing protein [Kibdelosporangium philippinense]